ncbi:MAG: hypoxanthine phosphoribosyltransferase [Lachnospiraceae bacterium]|nr:hypoxanthine phosphoribosyltransferase [Lachnospiraceae bacterium]
MKEKISVLLTEEEIKARIKQLGEDISRDYAGKELILIGILKGGVYFLTDLSRAIDDSVDVRLDFMQASSYGDEKCTSGVIRIMKDCDLDIKDKHVMVVEDIIDSGRTLSRLLVVLGDRKPASLRLCTLLDKPARREIEVDVDYVGFEIEDKYVVGLGLDSAQQYRNLSYIGVVEE